MGLSVETGWPGIGAAKSTDLFVAVFIILSMGAVHACIPKLNVPQ
jgi:hypothetical protein